MKVELKVGTFGHNGQLLLDGVDVSNHVRAITLTTAVGELTTAQVEFINVEVSLHGEMIVNGVPVYVESMRGIGPGQEEAA